MCEEHSLHRLCLGYCLKVCGKMKKLTERIARDSDFIQSLYPLLSFPFRERGGDNFKILLIVSFLDIRFRNLTAAQYVNSIAFVGSLDTLLPLYIDCPVIETHPPILIHDHEVSLLHTLPENARSNYCVSLSFRNIVILNLRRSHAQRTYRGLITS